MPEYALQIGYGLIGGLVAALVVYGILALKLFRLQLQVGACRDAILSLRNTGNVEKRWQRRDKVDAELEAFMAHQKNPNSEQRFANDPLPY